MEGQFDLPETYWRSRKGARLINGEKVIDKEIPDYDTPDFRQALQYWVDYKTFGLLYGTALGYGNHPCQYIDVIKLFEYEYNKLQNAEIKGK